MRTRNTLLLLFVFLVVAPVGAAIYLGSAGLQQQRTLLLTREAQVLNGRADDVRDQLVRVLQDLYREEQGRAFGDYVRDFEIARTPNQQPVVAPSPFQNNERDEVFFDRFQVDAKGRLSLPWGVSTDAPEDLIALVGSDRFLHWLHRRESPQTESRNRKQTLSARIVAWNLGRPAGSDDTSVTASYSPFSFFGDFAVRRVTFTGGLRIAQGFRVDTEQVAARFLDPVSLQSIVRRFDVHVDGVGLAREDAPVLDEGVGEYGLPRVLYRHVVPAHRDATPVLLPDGYRLAVAVRPAATLATAIDKAQTRLFWILGAVVLVALLGLLFGWRALRTESVLAERKTAFVSAVSHELRTPLTSIRMYADMLKEGWVKDDETARDYFGLIAAESERLARLVNNVLNFSRIEKGKKTFRIQPGDPAPVIREVAEVFRPYLKEKGFDLRVEIPESLPECSFDKDALSQIFVNLIDNAVKHGAGEHKEVRLEAECVNDRILLRVLDRGPGVSREDRAHIFDSFHRGTAAKPGSGSGLGLALVSHYVAAHDGSLQVTDRAGGGAVFSFTLPRADSP